MTSKKYVIKLARASGDKKQVYNVKLRLPVELARKLGMKHGTKVVVTKTDVGFTVRKLAKPSKKKDEEKPLNPPIIS